MKTSTKEGAGFCMNKKETETIWFFCTLYNLLLNWLIVKSYPYILFNHHVLW